VALLVGNDLKFGLVTCEAGFVCVCVDSDTCCCYVLCSHWTESVTLRLDCCCHLPLMTGFVLILH